jgi:ATP-dependent exoDNAse (exonuclease V) alpha subunit
MSQDITSISFSKEAELALELLQNSSEHLFITGKAGTGKSTLLSYFRKISKKRLVVLAPTGVAAINVNGETIHSFFKLKPGFELEEATHAKSSKAKKEYKNLKTLVIDEISMVRADLLDAIDIVLKKARGNSEPFGGVRMVFFGDLYQLPPVITKDDRDKFANDGYVSPYFFDAKIFEPQQGLFDTNFELKFIELLQVYRQKDEEFIEILNKIRNKSIDEDGLIRLNKRVDREFKPKDDEGYIYLTTTNKDASFINDSKLEKLDKDKFHIFCSSIKGEVPKNFYPNDLEVELRVGAQVMFIQNDTKRRWVNGTIGIVTDIKENRVLDELTDEYLQEYIVVVKKQDGNRVAVGLTSWEISKYVFKDGEFKRDILGSFSQIPLKLAWAITIHKSQGKTFNKAIIDLGARSFAHGQTYVALSRCTSLDGLVLANALTMSHIIMDKRIQIFITKHQYSEANKKFPFEDKVLYLKNAIKNSDKIEIEYLKSKDEHSKRILCPISVEEQIYKGSPFTALRAFCFLRDDIRIFSIKRILTINSLDDKCEAYTDNI